MSGGGIYENWSGGAVKEGAQERVWGQEVGKSGAGGHGLKVLSQSDVEGGRWWRVAGWLAEPGEEGAVQQETDEFQGES